MYFEPRSWTSEYYYVHRFPNVYNGCMIPALKSRSSQLLDAIRERFPGYHPLVSIAEIAHNDSADLELRFQCHKTIAKYIEPELKSIEVKSDNQTRSLLKVSLFEDADVSDAEIVESPKLGNW